MSTNTGMRGDDQVRHASRINAETLLESLGIDNYRVEGDRVFLSEIDWKKVARGLDYKLVSGVIEFECCGWRWVREK